MNGLFLYLTSDTFVCTFGSSEILQNSSRVGQKCPVAFVFSCSAFLPFVLTIVAKRRVGGYKETCRTKAQGKGKHS